jgi:hypothetical protein
MLARANLAFAGRDVRLDLFRGLANWAIFLSPAVVDFDALAIAPLPPREIIAGFDARFADLDQSARSERQALEAVHQEIERLISTLDELAAGWRGTTLSASSRISSLGR